MLCKYILRLYRLFRKVEKQVINSDEDTEKSRRYGIYCFFQGKTFCSSNSWVSLIKVLISREKETSEIVRRSLERIFLSMENTFITNYYCVNKYFIVLLQIS